MTCAQQLSVSTAALPGWQIEDALRAIASCGITNVEIVVGSAPDALQHDTRYIDRLRTILGVNGLEVVGVAASGELPAGHPGLPNVISVAQALGARYVRIFPPKFADVVPLRDQIEQMRVGLIDLCEHFDESTMEILIELAQDTLVPSPELARAALRPLDRHCIGVLYDPANMLVEGHLSVDLALACLEGLLRHVHVKNQVVTRQAGQLHRRFVSLQQGGVDWEGTLRALTRSGYRGGFTIDHLGGSPSPRRIRQDAMTFQTIYSRATDD